MDNDHDDRTDRLADFQSAQFLDRFENYLDEDVLQSFKKSTPKCEDTSLFEFWKKIGGCANTQNNSGDEINDVAVILNNEVEVEYIDTTYEECFQRGQIIEVVSVDNVIENGSRVNIGTHPSITSSTGPENDDDMNNNMAENTKTIGEASIEMREQLGSVNAQLNYNLCSVDGETATNLLGTDAQSIDDMTTTDEETTTDTTEETAPTDKVCHIPRGFPKYFQDALYWPGRKSDTSVKSKSKRKPKERVPAVLISKDFIEYLKNKEDEKLRLETEKAERKTEREMKKLEKQRQEQEKEKVLLERKMEKQRKDEEKEKQKAERQMEKEAKKIEKHKNEEEKKKAKVERKNKVEPKTSRKHN